MENQQNHEQGQERGHDHTHHEHSGQNKNTLMAVIAYILFFVPLLTEDKNDPFVRYHVRQGLAFLIASIVVWIFGTFVPIIGWILFFPLQLILLVIWIIGVVHAVNGEQKPLPIIGKFGEGLKI